MENINKIIVYPENLKRGFLKKLKNEGFYDENMEYFGVAEIYKVNE